MLAVGKHTLAPEDAGRFIIDAHARLVESRSDRGTVALELVSEAAERKQRIPGFGHPVFTYVDPRGQVLKELALAAGLWGRARPALRGGASEPSRPARTCRPIPIDGVGIWSATSPRWASP